MDEDEAVIQAQNPLLSVVTVTMMNDGGLSRSLESVAHQIRPHLVIGQSIEVIVVDGAARTESLDIARNILGDLCAWEVILEPDNGIYDGQNKGLRRCRGTYVQFLNSGDSYLPVDSALRSILSILGTDRPFWLIVGAKYGGGPHRGKRIANIPHIWWRHTLGLQAHCHQACFFLTKYLTAIGGHRLDVGLTADYDLIMKCGIVERPCEVDTQLISYEGGGVSAKDRSRVLRETMRIRLDRLNADGMADWTTRAALAPSALRRVLKGELRRALSLVGVVPRR